MILFYEYLYVSCSLHDTISFKKLDTAIDQFFNVILKSNMTML
jgi:hypothetical protein